LQEVPLAKDEDDDDDPANIASDGFA